MNDIRVCVTGAGGFIGHHLTSHLKRQGCWVRGVDLKLPEYEISQADEFKVLDLRSAENCQAATKDIDYVFALAADMGGMGYISLHHARIFHNNALINLHTLEASRRNRVRKYLYVSSACVYPDYLQEKTDVIALREEDAYPAQPQDAYGWEKLISERLCRYYGQDYDMQNYTVRLHNVFGPLGAWDGGREKAPAAICRKIAIAKIKGESEVEIWGDGRQTRSFCYIDDCIVGLNKLMHSEHHEPVNLGQDRLVTINQLVDLIADIANVRIVKKHIPGPQGVRGRNSDNSKLKEVLGWTPQVTLEEGLVRTYAWIESQVRERLAQS